MKTLLIQISSVIVAFALGFMLTPPQRIHPAKEREEGGPSHAWEMFDWWYSQRALPYDAIPQGAYQRAAVYAKTKMKRERISTNSISSSSQWHSLGPDNIAGRMLSLAVNPLNAHAVWSGSASGGLWKSNTGGVGANAWSIVFTGFPSLSVSTIAIDPSDTSSMYIGTGEVSFYQFGQIGTPGARSSYGLGILKSSDGGTTWSQTGLTWTFPQITAVEKIVINPINPRTIFAATSEGVYKSTNGGSTWTVSNTVLMAMDIVINPSDTSTLYASHGNLNSSPDPGIYKTTDAGISWVRLTNGLPPVDFGRTALAMNPINPSIVYAGISSASATNAYALGLYRTTDAGASWAMISDVPYLTLGWYANAIAVKPNDPGVLFCAGLDLYRSTDTGSTFTKRTDWSLMYLIPVSPGGPEGPSNYAHADHHAIAFDPANANIAYVATDGGVFKTTDGGSTFSGCNGGLVTTQFYNGLANAWDDSVIVLGGLQDNGIIQNEGNNIWNKHTRIDGGWCAIDPTNNNLLYGEDQYLAVEKSTDGGSSFFPSYSGLPAGQGGEANFIAPFVIAHTSPNILYAGAKLLYKTTNGALNWTPTNGGAPLNGTKISCIGVSFLSPDTLIAATGARALESPTFQVFQSTNGGQSWTNVTGSLPNRFPTDIEFDPTNSTIAYITFSGYGTPHLFRTTDVGLHWANISANLPDIPHQSVTVDPLQTQNIYVGTDLGVFHSSDDGASWEEYNGGMPQAMVTDLTISRPNGSLRAATFGNGVYERKLVRVPDLKLEFPKGGDTLAGGYPAVIRWSQKFLSTVNIEYSLNNGADWSLVAANVPASQQSYIWTVPDTATLQGRIRIEDTAPGGPVDSTTAPFSVLLNPDVFAGWNLLSVNLRVPDPRKVTLFPNAASSAFAYASSYVVSETLMHGNGYWLKFHYPGFNSFSGDSILADTVKVRQGWNMIGSISRPVSTGSIVPIGTSIQSSTFGYQFGYYVTDTIKPGLGYWVKVSSDGGLILGGGSAFVNRSATTDCPISSFSALTVRDAGGNDQKLYFAGEACAGPNPSQASGNRGFMMPPLPPEGVFDVRYSTGTMLEIAGRNQTREIPIQISSGVFPLTIEWRNSGTPAGASLLLDGREISMRENGTTRMASPTSHISLRIHPAAAPVTAIPREFVLDRNYPNPFNPSTAIRYSIPGIADQSGASIYGISLKVYNPVGQVVATLVDGNKQPGVYTVTWDAGRMASGVYFYRLIATGSNGRQSFQSARKMVLIR